MTPQTEKPFEPTPEQVEEATRKAFDNYRWPGSKYFTELSSNEQNGWRIVIKAHLAELSTLRSQVEEQETRWSKMAIESAKVTAAIATERDVLKAQVAAYEEAKTSVVGYLTIHGSKDVADLIQFAFKDALTQLEGK